jgi:hypothetical protein
MTGNIDLLEAELMVAQTECDDIDRAIAQSPLTMLTRWRNPSNSANGARLPVSDC